jgi:Dolichyl-phosphate-mannose-protein mannosyltransferase
MHKNVSRSANRDNSVWKGSDARRPLALFLGAVFLLKLLIVLQLRNHPLLQPDAGLDTTAYADLARQVLAGNVALGPGLYFVSPFYIYFLAAALAIFRSFTAVRVLQVGMGTLAVACTFFTAREWFGARAGWYAAALAALTGLFTFYEAIILQAAVDPFITAAALLALTLAARGESPTAFDERCIRGAGVAPRSNTDGILARRAFRTSRLSPSCWCALALEPG